MKNTKNESILAAGALAGLLLLFGGFLFAGNGRTMILMAVIVVCCVVFAAVLFRYIQKHVKTYPIFTAVASQILAITLGLCLTINVFAAFSFTPTEAVSGLYVSVSSANASSVNSSANLSTNTKTALTIDVTAYGYYDCGNKTDTITVTIKNNNDYRVTFALKLTAATLTQGSETELAANAEMKITVTSGSGTDAKTDGKIEFSNIYVDQPAVEVETTFFNSTLGQTGVAYSSTVGGTYTVDGAAITDTTPKTKISTQAYTLKATPATGYIFYCWMSAGGKLSDSAEYSYTAEVGKTNQVWPVFIKQDSAVYFVKEASPTVYYGYLNDAIDGATKISGTIVVSRSGTAYHSDVTQNTFTIPSGVKLLVPFSSDNASCFGSPVRVATAASTKKAYVTLTLSDKTVINCNGGMICVNAQQLSDVHNSGYVAGDYGHIEMLGNSQIKLTNGAILYAYGFISGEGTVSAASGTQVHELIHIPGWRGGAVSGDLLSKHESGNFNSLIFVNYYIQNVLCNLKISGGAAAVVHGSISPSSTPKPFSAPLVSPSGFQLDGEVKSPQFLLSSDGLISRKYDASTDRMLYTIEKGTVETSGMTLTMDGTPLETSSFIFPLDSSMTLRIGSSAEFIISKQMKLLPESELIIDFGGTCTVSGSLFVYDADQWVNKTYALKATGSSDSPCNMAPSLLPSQFKTFTTRSVSKDAKLHVDGLLNVTSSGGNAYSSAGGGNICGTGEIRFGDNVSTAVFQVDECYNREKPSFTYVGVTEKVEFNPLIANLAGYDGKTSMSSNTSYFGVVISGTSYWYQEAKCSKEGTTVFYCTGAPGSVQLANTEAPIRVHDWNNCVCTVCGIIKFYASNIRLGNNLDMLFAFPKAGITDPTGYYVCAVRVYSDGTSEEIIFTYGSHSAVITPIDAQGNRGEPKTVYCGENTWKSTDVDGVKCYYVTYSGFAAKEMAETVSLTIYRSVVDGDDVAVSTVFVDSIRDYALRMLQKATAEINELDDNGDGVADDNTTENAKRLKYLTCQRTLVVDMLNYGAACQTHFNYNTGDLANAKIAEYSAFGTLDDTTATDSSSKKNDYWIGSNVMADSNSQFVIAFSSEFKEGMYFTYEFTNHWGKPVFRKVYCNKTDMTSFEKMYHGLANLRLADARILITFKIYDGTNVEPVAEWTDSVESYCARMSTNDSDVYMALLKFADSAYAYLHYDKEETTT